jgi:hypothetical protein
MCAARSARSGGLGVAIPGQVLDLQSDQGVPSVIGSSPQ